MAACARRALIAARLPPQARCARHAVTAPMQRFFHIFRGRDMPDAAIFDISSFASISLFVRARRASWCHWYLCARLLFAFLHYDFLRACACARCRHYARVRSDLCRERRCARYYARSASIMRHGAKDAMICSASAQRAGDTRVRAVIFFRQRRRDDAACSSAHAIWCASAKMLMIFERLLQARSAARARYAHARGARLLICALCDARDVLSAMASIISSIFDARCAFCALRSARSAALPCRAAILMIFWYCWWYARAGKERARCGAAMPLLRYFAMHTARSSRDDAYFFHMQRGSARALMFYFALRADDGYFMAVPRRAQQRWRAVRSITQRAPRDIDF